MPTTEEMRALVGELRASAGLGGRGGAESLEVFLLFPDTFRRKYAELCVRALKGALEAGGGLDEGAGGGAGGAAEAARVGKAKVDVGKYKGKRVGAGAGGGGKRYKVFWTVRDENALEVKSRIDRRLRALARDIDAMLEARAGTMVHEGQVTTKGRCSCCGRYVEAGWLYCPTCGAEVRYETRTSGR